MAAVQRLAAGHAELDLGLAGVAGCGPYAAVRTGEVHAIALDSKEAGEELGWKPSVDIVEDLQRTVQWLREALDRCRPLWSMRERVHAAN